MGTVGPMYILTWAHGALGYGRFRRWGEFLSTSLTLWDTVDDTYIHTYIYIYIYINIYLALPIRTLNFGRYGIFLNYLLWVMQDFYHQPYMG